MFCPKCGTPDQKPETFCRQCGIFLPDFDKLKRKETPPEEHLSANSILNIMTAVVSGALAILLHAFLYRQREYATLDYCYGKSSVGDVLLGSADNLAEPSVETTAIEKKKEREG